MSSTDGEAVLSITVVGRTEKRPLARSEAQPGWAVAVTGPLGASATALRERRSIRLVPLLEEGRRLNEAGLCCGGISASPLRGMEQLVALLGSRCRIRADQGPGARGAHREGASDTAQRTPADVPA